MSITTYPNSLLCIVLLSCYLLHSVHSADEDLLDFDFSDLKEIDWNYENENTSNEVSTVESKNKKLQTNLVDFDDDYDENANSGVNAFDWREKVLKNALSKALTNKDLRQKFVEVMPIMRVLSSQQKLTLSALISAQINAKKGQELKLEQVRSMFGNDKKLLIPLIFDIANLVRNSALKYLQSDDLELKLPLTGQTPLEKRTFELNSAELAEERSSVGTLATSASLEDFMGTEDTSGEFIDPLRINEQLQASMEPMSDKNESVVTTAPSLERSKRALLQPTEFVHKLMRSVPLYVNEDDLQKGTAGLSTKLNTTAFELPAEEAYHEVEDLAFASLNGSVLSLQDNDISPSAAMSNDNSSNNLEKKSDESLPTPEELIAGPRYRTNNNKLRFSRPPIPTKLQVASKRVRGNHVRTRPVQPDAAASSVLPTSRKCQRFTASMCISTEDYPLEQIMGSIRRHKNAMSALLAEYYDKPFGNAIFEEDEDMNFAKKRRDDETGGGMCKSVVRYARPQKARSASGEWKFIVNTGQHTQTLRLEKCSNPQESCSYLAHSYRSHCAQVYNYHRLLSWDKTRGLHVDIFKVPTCCSCQVDGYQQQFPPLGNTYKEKHHQSAVLHSDLYSTLPEDLDYNEEEDDINFQSSYESHRSQHKLYDTNELGTKKVSSHQFSPSVTVGPYLSPPDSEEFDNFAIKSSSPLLSGATNYHHSIRRRPYPNVGAPVNEARVDLDFAPSENHADKEVNHIVGKTHASNNNDKKPQAPKRKRIYSVPHTASTTAGGRGTSAAAVSAVSAGGRGAATLQSSHGTGTIHGGNSYSSPLSPHTTAPSPSSTTTHAHQAYHTFHNTATSVSSQSKTAANSGGVAKQRTRYTRPFTTATTATSAATPTTKATAARTTPAPIYHVNSIYGVNYNGSHTSYSRGNKRINYSYHPIIDFFESNKRSVSTSTEAATLPSSSATNELLYPLTIPKVTHERRMGYSAAGKGGTQNAVLPDESRVRLGNNAWQPVMATP